ncbi:MAG TPA: oligosaccharide flippase family protein, partial [Minicystis sp.]|nr:oligosaccharide flippase family protein [Minicystis sp.]
MSTTGADTAKAAGRGGLAIAAAKVSFMVFGAAQTVLLTHLLGVSRFGDLQHVLIPLNFVNNVVVGSSIQGVSHAVSSAPSEAAPAAYARVLRLHAALAVAVGALFALAAPVVARFLEAEEATAELRLMAIVVVLYGLYAPIVGSLNGARRFGAQAGLDVTYQVLRTAALAIGALLLGVPGALVGFGVAAAAIVPIALARAGIGRRGDDGSSTRAYGAYFAPLFAGQVALNLLMASDITLLSHFAGVAATALGRGKEDAATLVGAYKNAQLFSFLPYQFLLSVSFVLFPMLAKARSEKDAGAVASFTRAGIRLALVFTGLVCSVVSGLAPHLLRFAFPKPAYELAGDALRVLSLGMGAFAVLGITSTALASVGRSGLGALLNAAAVVLIAGGCVAFVPHAAFGPEMLLHTAIATSAALFATALVGAILLRRENGAFVAPATVVRVGAALAVSVAVGARMP